MWDRFDDRTDILTVRTRTDDRDWEVADKVLRDRDADPVLYDDAEAFLMRRYNLTPQTCTVVDHRPTATRPRRTR